MGIERKIPVEWEGWDSNDICDIFLYDTYFFEAFGPIPKGSRFPTININYAYGYLEAYYDEGSGPVTAYHVQFDLTPHCLNYKDNVPDYFGTDGG